MNQRPPGRRAKRFSAATVPPLAPPRMFSSHTTHADVAVDLGVRVRDDELEVLGVAEQPVPRPRDRAPAPQRRPAGMRAHDPVAVLPELGHGVDVAGLEGVVERLVGLEDRLERPPLTW